MVFIDQGSIEIWRPFATPTGNPPAGAFLVYLKSDGLAYKKNSSGTESLLSEPPIAAGSTTQYWRGDKSWQTLNPAAVGAAAATHTHVATTDLTATGTKDGTTFLRGDNTWAVPSGGAAANTNSTNVRAASTANVVIATGGLLTIDSIVLAAGDLVLLKNQTAPAENGIYTVASGAWARTPAFSTAAGIAAGEANVLSGTTNGGTEWRAAFKSTDVLGTTAMNWYRTLDSSATYVDTTTTQSIGGTKTFTGFLGLDAGVKQTGIVDFLGDNTGASSGTPLKSPGAWRFYTRYWDGTTSQTELANFSVVRNSVTPGDHYFSFAAPLRATTLSEGTVRVYSPNNAPGASSLSATGTRDATTFLRGDNTWAAPAAGGATGIAPALVATTANITLSGTQTIDGVILVVSQRVLVKNQTTQSENGVWVVQTGAWTRAADATAAATTAGGTVFVQSGTTQGPATYRQNLVVGTIGTDIQAWSRLAETTQLPLTVRAATTAAITLSGLQTVDGVALAAGDRVLVRMQGVGSGNTFDNGVYTAATTAWVRATDADAMVEIAGSQVNVQAGTLFAGQRFLNANVVTDTLGTTGIKYFADRVEVVPTTAYPTPVGPGHTLFDITRQTYVIWDGTGWRDAAVPVTVVCTTTANITLSAPQTIDGITLVAGDRVLVKDQTTASQNGVYTVQAAAWTRTAPFTTPVALAAVRIAILSGATFGGTDWVTTFKSTDTVDTTAMPWYQILNSLNYMSQPVNTATQTALNGKQAAGSYQPAGSYAASDVLSSNGRRGTPTVTVSTANTNASTPVGFVTTMGAVPTIVTGLFATSALSRSTAMTAPSTTGFTQSVWSGTAASINTHWIALTSLLT